MDKLYDFIIKNCDSKFISYIEKNYRGSLRQYLCYGLDYRYIDDMYVLETFHNIYLKLKEENKESLELKLISDKYLLLMSKIKRYREGIRDFDTSVSHNPISIDLEEIEQLKKNCDKFSLNELFSYDNILNYYDRICAVCLITPLQTASMFNENENGFSGIHNDSFHKLIRGIYSESFKDSMGFEYNDTGQDIRVCFSNGFMSTKDGNIQRIIITVDVPVPITSSQKKSLEILNEEIKKYELENNVRIEVSSALVNYYDEEFFIEFDDRDNLDEILNFCVINDECKREYKDKNVIGFINGENHFNDSLFRLCERKISR